MKKTFLMMLVATGLLAVSCEKSFDDGGGSATDGTAKVSVNLGFPKMQSRAYSDGTTATHLQYTIYEVNKEGKIIQQLDTYTKTDDEINISKQIDFQLVTGRYYTFVFWAAAPSEEGWTNPYTVNLAAKGATMTAAYSATTVANDERLDAFFASVPVKQITGDVEMTVELTRPFAQINLGTSDWEIAEEMNATPNRSYIYVKNAYTQLDLVSGNVLGEASEIPLGYGQIPGSTYNGNTKAAETFPVAGYDYLAMAYILANAEQEVVTVSFGYAKDADASTVVSRTVGSVPIQRNHRTNLFGEVLTSNASLNIIIKPEYVEPDYNYDQLLFAAAVGGSTTLTGDVKVPGELTFTKDAVIDLGGHEIITEGGKYGDALVIGNGANVTLRNGTVKQAEKATVDDASAVIYVKKSTTASTLTLEDMKVEGFRPIYLNNPAEGTTVTIKSGTYTCTGTSGEAVYVQKGGKVIIEGGTFSNPNSQYSNFLLNVHGDLLNGTGKTSRDFIEVRGGTFVGFDPAANAADGNPTNYVADGYKSIKDGDNYVVVPNEIDAVADAAEDLTPLWEGNETGNIAMINDLEIDASETTADSGYGEATGISVKNGSVIDGCGNTLTVNGANTTWDCAVNPVNGTIKNLTINGAFRGIFMSGATGDVFVDNVVIDHVCYAFNSNEGNKDYGVYFTNCTLNGWTSFTDGHKEVVFKNCNFGKGSGVYKYAYCRPYNACVFENCKFAEGFQFDVSQQSASTVFKNCTYGDVKITAENAESLASGDTVFFNEGIASVSFQ